MKSAKFKSTTLLFRKQCCTDYNDVSNIDSACNLFEMSCTKFELICYFAVYTIIYIV